MPERKLAEAMVVMDAAVDRLIMLRKQTSPSSEIAAALRIVEEASERVRNCITQLDVALSRDNNMTIEPFHRSKTEWLLVTGLRSLPPMGQSYETHWTGSNWSSFDAAMTFTSEAEAQEFIAANRRTMEVAERPMHD